MEKKIDYRELYILQDKILKLIFSLDNVFYLTGCTALHRKMAQDMFVSIRDLNSALSLFDLLFGV